MKQGQRRPIYDSTHSRDDHQPRRSSISRYEEAGEQDSPVAEGTRLNKALAAAGVCSRRQADVLIERGEVRVNGRVVTELGLRVDPALDRIEVSGRTLPQADSRTAGHTYVLMHKPVSVVTTVSDPQQRTTVIDLLPRELKGRRLFPVGRLDFFSEGLLLLTDDGELTNRLTHPRWHLPKVYHVHVRGVVSPETFRIMESGMTLAEGERLAPVRVRQIGHDERSIILEMTLHQGLNRQIRRMCRDLGLTVLKLVRVQQGPIALEDLPVGSCRPLSAVEISALKKAVGLTPQHRS